MCGTDLDESVFVGEGAEFQGKAGSMWDGGWSGEIGIDEVPQLRGKGVEDAVWFLLVWHGGIL